MIMFEPNCDNENTMAYVSSEDPNQQWHPISLIRHSMSARKMLDSLVSYLSAKQRDLFEWTYAGRILDIFDFVTKRLKIVLDEQTQGSRCVSKITI